MNIYFQNRRQYKNEKIWSKVDEIARKEKEYVLDILSNDEVSTDEELIELFKKETGLNLDVIEAYITDRNLYLNNIV